MIRLFIIKKLKTNGLVTILNKGGKMQEEELTVSEILSSIRNVLAKETKDLDLGVTTENSSSFNEEKQAVVNKPVFAPVTQKVEAVFELTPQMRVEKETFLSTTPTMSMKSALTDVVDSDHIQAHLKPMMQDWLDKNLPQIVEKVVSQEVKRLFAGK